MDTQFRSGIGGTELLQAFEFASGVLNDRRDQLNALNVFPVPDGDTGTNMAHTMRSAIDAAKLQSASPNRPVDRVAASLARGALMGAHGNSGVILSQILRGFATAVVDRSSLDANDVAGALASAAQTAYQAVADPVEGTMLTVIGAASRAAATTSRSSSNVLDIFDAAATGAMESLATTPSLLEVLSRAHVVDAGGQGIAYILRAVANHLRGDQSEFTIGEDDQFPLLAGNGAEHFDESGYCTNFVIFSSGLDIELVRREFNAIGTSLVVAGDESLVKIHIHSERPDKVLALALQFGNLDRVSIDNMDRQIEEIAFRDVQRSVADVLEADVAGKHATIGFAAGAGLAKALLSLGASTVVQVGGGSGPTTDELRRIVESSKVASVLLVPSSRELLAACGLVQAGSSGSIRVVPSDSFAGALTALSALSLGADLDTNAERATNAMANTIGIEVVTATEDGLSDGIEFSTGESLCLVNGILKAAHIDPGPALIFVLDDLGSIDPDICTVFVGQGVSQPESETIAGIVADAFSDAEIEVIDGGQAYYRFIIAIE